MEAHNKRGDSRLTLATLIGLRSLFVEPCTNTSHIDATGFEV
jgi:hypothetical protein